MSKKKLVALLFTLAVFLVYGVVIYLFCAYDWALLLILKMITAILYLVCALAGFWLLWGFFSDLLDKR